VVKENEKYHKDEKDNKTSHGPFQEPFIGAIRLLDIKGCSIRGQQPEHVGYDKQHDILGFAAEGDVMKSIDKNQIHHVEDQEIHADEEESEKIAVATVHMIRIRVS
jgi:hypothetical protein